MIFTVEVLHSRAVIILMRMFCECGNICFVVVKGMRASVGWVSCSVIPDEECRQVKGPY
jgi:hypothetical protein